MTDNIFIPGNVPSLKNGKIWTGKFLVASKTVKDYLKFHNIKYFSSSKHIVEHNKNGVNTFENEVVKLKKILEDLEPPFKFSFHFVRKSKHRFDFGNAVEILSDLFTSYGLIEDDNMEFFHPSVFYIDDKGFTYNKLNPGVIIQILQTNKKI